MIRTRLGRAGAMGAPLLLVLLVLMLAAGLSQPAARMLQAWSAPAAQDDTVGTLTLASLEPPAPLATQSPDTGTRQTPLCVDAFAATFVGPPVPGRQQADAEDGPAVVRASEAGLNRMRVQFAQAVPLALPSDDDSPGTPRAVPAEDLTRDARAPGGARADAGGKASAAPAAPPLAASRVLSLPPGAGDAFALPGAGSVTPIGHATLLIRAGGFTILTDPDFLRRGEPARLGFRRVVARQADPAIDLDALPRIDLVVLSRLSEDRFDRIVRRRLARDVPIVAPAEARAALVAMGFSSVHALPAWDRLAIDRDGSWLRITSTPTRPRPALLSALAPQSMGNLMEFGRGDGAPAYRIWITGDTRVDDDLLTEWRTRLPEVDLAVLHLGGPGVAGIGHGSMDGDTALRLLRGLAPRVALPLALDDFGGTPAAPLDTQPPTITALGGAPQTRVRILARGDTHRFAPAPRWASARDDGVIGP
jgi:L-ascorbate metabolism protein UlaG (beta-lactamase superfamily)